LDRQTSIRMAGAQTTTGKKRLGPFDVLWLAQGRHSGAVPGQSGDATKTKELRRRYTSL
jgi:hypothetical protein